jgi:hypothetical protein
MEPLVANRSLLLLLQQLQQYFHLFRYMVQAQMQYLHCGAAQLNCLHFGGTQLEFVHSGVLQLEYEHLALH